MFADLGESIRQLLVQRGNLDPAEIDVSFDAPTREWAAGLSRPTVNLYLFDIRENTELRNPIPWTVRSGPNNTAIKSRPEVRIDLTYRITAFANAVEGDHRLLSRVLVTVFQYPILPPELLQGQATGQEIITVAAQPNGLVQSPGDYWSVVDNDLKPSIDYRATVRIDMNQETSVGLSRGANLKIGRMDGQNGDVPAEQVPQDIGGRIHRREAPEQGIAGATVRLVERGLDTTTDAQGRYRLRRLPAGSYTLVIAAPGLNGHRAEIQVPSGSYDVGI